MVQISLKIYLSEKIFENEYEYTYGKQKDNLVSFVFYNVVTDKAVSKKMTYKKAIQLAYMRARDGRYKNYEYIIEE